LQQAQRWKQRPAGSNWGEFGPDDQLGRLNLLTPEKVRQAAVEIQEGRVFCLSLPLDYPGGNVLNPRRFPPILRPTIRNGRVNFNYKLSQDKQDATDVLSDDAVILHTQYSTQWDGLSHVGQMFDADGDGVPEAIYYNGFRAGEDIIGPTDVADAGAIGVVPAQATSAAKALGIEHMARTGVQGRGVMIDLHAHVGRERVAIGYDALMRILEVDRVEIEKGDMVCFHTGLGEMIVEMGGKPSAFALENSCAVLDGTDSALLNWITDTGLAVIAADNYAVEEHPPTKHNSGCCATVPLHEHCLFKLGIHLGELWYLTELADWLRQNRRSRFFLTAPPLRLPGAVGSPATPVATV
jgi:kynurenine formamidase